MARYESAGEIISRVLAESGITPPNDPFQSQDPAVIQMTYLLTSVGRQLLKLHEWEYMQRSWSFVTAGADTGKYALPDDFDRMIPQTGWSRTQRVRVPGSVTPQIWSYLRGRNLVSSTIYAVFREVEDQLWLYPQPPDASVPEGLTIAFEYISRWWVGVRGESQGVPVIIPSKDSVGAAGDLVLFDPTMTERMLKLRFREARGMDSQAAQNEALQMFSSVTSQDVAGDVLNAAGMSQPYPYLNMRRNTPDTGFGY